jgi:hypothetical protein
MSIQFWFKTGCDTQMRESYLEREVHTNVKEDHDGVNEADILGFTNDDIEF